MNRTQPLDRRAFLKSAAAAAGGSTLLTASPLRALGGVVGSAQVPVIDTHIHLYDTARPGGVPWPEPGDLIYRPALPPRYQALVAGLGIRGAIAVEASPLRSDNQWLLATARQSPFIVGVIGDLDPAAPDFPASLDQHHQDPLFRGIRYGNLWDRDLLADLDKPRFLDGLKLLAQAGLVLESANPDPRLIHALARITAQVPTLTLIVDHLPNGIRPADGTAKSLYLDDLHTLAQSPNVYVKLSEIVNHPAGTSPPPEGLTASRRQVVEELWHTFGENKLMYGSDWPNSDHELPYPAIYQVFQSFIRTQSPAAQQKVCWRNSKQAYHWSSRTAQQP